MGYLRRPGGRLGAFEAVHEDRDAGGHGGLVAGSEVGRLDGGTGKSRGRMADAQMLRDRLLAALEAGGQEAWLVRDMEGSGLASEPQGRDGRGEEEGTAVVQLSRRQLLADLRSKVEGTKRRRL